MRPDRLFLNGLGSHDIDDEACDQTTQIEAAIEPVGKACQVVLGVLAVLQGVVRPGKCGLEIAEDGVDPLEAGQVTRLEAADHHRKVKATSIGHRTEAPSPSLCTLVPGARLALAHLLIASEVNPLTTLSLMYIGCP